MGHTRLGSIPKTQKWKSVVSLIAGGGATGAGAGSSTLLAEDVETIALQALDAAQNGLKAAIDDIGLQYVFYMLTQLVLSSRGDDWQAQLENIGIQLSEDATVFDLTAAFQNVIDDYLFEHSRSSDISEIAQKAAGEAITALASINQLSLLDSSRDELKSVIHSLSTKNGFSRLGQVFFGRFMSRFLNFYLSRVTAAHLDSDRLQQIGDVSNFNQVLQRHCEQSARILYEFCGQWYSKTEFQQGIDLYNASRFMAVAMKKLQAELKQQRGEV